MTLYASEFCALSKLTTEFILLLRQIENKIAEKWKRLRFIQCILRKGKNSYFCSVEKRIHATLGLQIQTKTSGNWSAKTLWFLFNHAVCTYILHYFLIIGLFLCYYKRVVFILKGDFRQRQTLQVFAGRPDTCSVTLIPTPSSPVCCFLRTVTIQHCMNISPP